MDFHRKLQGKDTPIGRDCGFCSRMDPAFAQRSPMDRLVVAKLDDSASAHLTEDGYVKHRIAEMMKKHSSVFFQRNWSKSA